MRLHHHLFALLAILATLTCVGCPLASAPAKIESVSSEPSDELDELIERTLEQNLAHRKLGTDTHGAWQILHGVLAYGQEFPIATPRGVQPTIGYLLAGGSLEGFEPLAGDLLGDPPRPGLRMEMQPSTKIGQGHRDQWLAIFAQCGLPLETELVSDNRVFTLGDWLRQAEFDVPRNLELEFSWSLIALAAYRDTEHRWIARDGVEYSVADLLYSESEQSMPSSVCGGTHRLIGIAMSLNKRRAEGRPISGVWAHADEEVAKYVNAARKNQNADGTFSVSYLHRPGFTRDLGESLGTTGHVLEFLAFAASDEVLQEPWVERSARRLCQMLEQCKVVDLECGVLYHALHGLQEFRQRRRAIDENSPS